MNKLNKPVIETSDFVVELNKGLPMHHIVGDDISQLYMHQVGPFDDSEGYKLPFQNYDHYDAPYPPVMNDMDFSGNPNVVTIHDLAEIMAWLIKHSDEYSFAHVRHPEYGFIQDYSLLPRKFTKINKALNTYPEESIGKEPFEFVHHFGGYIDLIVLRRISQQVFTMEIIL